MRPDHLKLIVKSIELHHKDEIHSVFATFIDDPFEKINRLVYYTFLGKNLFDKFDKSTHLVGFDWIYFVSLHHSFDFVFGLTVPLPQLKSTEYSISSSIRF